MSWINTIGSTVLMCNKKASKFNETYSIAVGPLRCKEFINPKLEIGNKMNHSI